jgi:hypothetical protein
MTPEICPHCGAEVPDGAKACPECGADESTGWNERATSQRLDLPDDEFDYDEFVREEFESPKPRTPHWLWLVTAGGLLLAMAWWLVRR